MGILSPESCRKKKKRVSCSKNICGNFLFKMNFRISLATNANGKASYQGVQTPFSTSASLLIFLSVGTEWPLTVSKYPLLLHRSMTRHMTVFKAWGIYSKVFSWESKPLCLLPIPSAVTQVTGQLGQELGPAVPTGA